MGSGPQPDRELAERLHRLARHASVLESPGFSFGDWAPTVTNSDGSISFPWYEFSPEAEAFLADARAFVTPFDWPSWAKTDAGQALLNDPAAVASASAEDLGRLITTLFRGERIGDGTLEAAFERGILAAIARRADVLARVGTS